MNNKKFDYRSKSKWTCKTPLYIDGGDRRWKKYQKQLDKNGFSDTETWNLSQNIAEFILPRLIRFKKITCAFPGGDITQEKWDKILDEMIFAFEWTIFMDYEYQKLSVKQIKDNNDRCYNGLQLFSKYFFQLGW